MRTSPVLLLLALVGCGENEAEISEIPPEPSNKLSHPVLSRGELPVFRENFPDLEKPILGSTSTCSVNLENCIMPKGGSSVRWWDKPKSYFSMTTVTVIFR